MNQTWTGGKLQTATVKSKKGMPCNLCYPGIAGRKVMKENGEEVTYTVVNANNITFPTEEGALYSIDMNQQSTAMRAVKNDRRPDFKVARNGDWLTVTGHGIARVEAFDAAGRQVAESASLNFRAPKAITLIKVTYNNGDQETVKVN